MLIWEACWHQLYPYLWVALAKRRVVQEIRVYDDSLAKMRSAMKEQQREVDKWVAAATYRLARSARSCSLPA